MRPWGLIAEKRLHDIFQSEQREQQLRDELKRLRTASRIAADEADSPAMYAIRAEVFGDVALALEQWMKLKNPPGSDSEGRVFRLLAARKVLELGQKVPRGKDVGTTRMETIKQKLDTAAALANDKPAEARAICRDVVALYGPAGDPDLRASVDRAQRLLAELSR